MKIGNQSFVKINNVPTSHRKGEQLTTLSLGLLAALGATTTVAQADPTANSVLETSPDQYVQYNSGDPSNYQIQVPVQSVTDDSQIPSLYLVSRQSNLLYQRILMHHGNRLSKSFNVNQFVNQQQTFHQALAPQTLQLPASSPVNRVKHQRAWFLIKLQIMVTLYVLFRNFIPLFKGKREKKLRMSKSHSAYKAHKARSLTVIVKFHDVYNAQDGLTAPRSITKSGPSDKMYTITAPADWAFVQPHNVITDQIRLNYRDGNQVIDVIPVYKSLTYKYDQATKTLKFTHGTLNDDNCQSFLDKENPPHNISASEITSVKFAGSAQVQVSRLRSMFTHNPYLRSIYVKGSVIKRRSIKLKHSISKGPLHRRHHVVVPKQRAPHQAETDALNELSTMIGDLNNERH